MPLSAARKDHVFSLLLSADPGAWRHIHQSRNILSRNYYFSLFPHRCTGRGLIQWYRWFHPAHIAIAFQRSRDCAWADCILHMLFSRAGSSCQKADNAGRFQWTHPHHYIFVASDTRRLLQSSCDRYIAAHGSPLQRARPAEWLPVPPTKVLRHHAWPRLGSRLRPFRDFQNQPPQHFLHERQSTRQRKPPFSCRVQDSHR